MRYLTITSLVVTQIFLTPVTHAATLEDIPQMGRDMQSRSSTFAGARIRLNLGGRKATRMRAGLTIAPLRSGQSARGVSFTKFGEGMEFGFTDRKATPHFSIAGRSLEPKRLGAAGGDGDESDKRSGSGLRTAGFIVGGVLVVAGIGALLFFDAVNDASD